MKRKKLENKQQPIRDYEKVKDIADDLKSINERDYFYFILSINIGRRSGDTIDLRVKDASNKDALNIIEKKTGKEVLVELNPYIKREIKKYCEGKNRNDYLFPSRNKKNGKVNYISYDRIYKIMSKVMQKHGTETFGTHTLRKTFGYWYYKRTKDIIGLMEMFNHESIEVTFTYIGITKRERKYYMREFKGLGE